MDFLSHKNRWYAKMLEPRKQETNRWKNDNWEEMEIMYL